MTFAPKKVLIMTSKLRQLVAPVLLALALLIPLVSMPSAAYASPASTPAGVVFAADTPSYKETPSYPDDSPTTSNQQQGNSNAPQNNQQQDTHKTPQLDTTERDHEPAVKTDPNKNYGEFLKGGTLDQEGLNKGYQAAQPWVKFISIAVGWIIALTFIFVFLTRALGLFYVTVPIGFIRNILSGGLYGNATGMHSPGQQMGGMMSGRMGGGGMMGMSQPPAGSAAQGGVLRHLRIVPASAIQAVELAESGGTGGASGMRPGMMQSGGAFGAGMGMPAQQVGGSAKMVSPIRYYLMKELWELVFLGFAVVVLILSPVLPDSGIALGNGFVQFIYWVLSYIV